MPPGRNVDVLTYIVEVSMSGLHKNITGLVPSLNRVTIFLLLAFYFHSKFSFVLKVHKSFL